jgi:hypothetical protein
MVEIEKEFNDAIVEESLREKYPNIDPADIARLQGMCKNPWDALALYEMMLILRRK